jgi:hypothetical protein
MTIDEARGHIGEGVVYMPAHGDRITSVSDRFVFVRYTGCQHSKATDPADLEPLAAW